jgi:hypothetical protein
MDESMYRSMSSHHRSETPQRRNLVTYGQRYPQNQQQAPFPTPMSPSQGSAMDLDDLGENFSMASRSIKARGNETASRAGNVTIQCLQSQFYKHTSRDSELGDWIMPDQARHRVQSSPIRNSQSVYLKLLNLSLN